MIWSVLVARRKSGACDDADQRCALRCPTRLQSRIRRAWIKDAGSADTKDASRKGPPCCSVLCERGASLLCLSWRCQPSWSGGFAIGWRVGGDDGDQRRCTMSIKSGTKTGWDPVKEWMRMGSLAGKAVVPERVVECREKWTGCAIAD